MRRRRVLAGIGAVGVASLAGCMELLEEGVESEAQPAAVDAAVVDDHGYDRVGTEDYTIDETVEVGGESRDVTVTSWGTTYSKDAADLTLHDESEADQFEDEVADLLGQEGAGFAAISTPSESIAGQELNPVGRMDDAELIDEFNDEIVDGEVHGIDHADEHEVAVLGESTTANEFDAIAETDEGEEFPIRIVLTEVDHEDDIVLGVGVYPDGTDELETILELTEHVDHPVEPDD